MKKFPVIKSIGQEPLYFGLSLQGFFALVLCSIIVVFVCQTFIAYAIGFAVVAMIYKVLLDMQKKYGNHFFTKYLKFYLTNWKGTKVSLSVIKETLNKKKDGKQS